MSAVTPLITTAFEDITVQILLIVAGLAVIVGIGVLVAYGFRKLKSVGRS
jgi:hypothetical protein